MADETFPELVARFGGYLDSWDVSRQQFRDWLAGQVDGGPNGDGYYPMTDASGGTYLYPCIAKFQALYSTFEPVDVTGAAITILPEHDRKRLRTQTPTTVITIPTGLGDAFACEILHEVAGGTMDFAFGAGVTNGSLTGASQSLGPGSLIGLTMLRDNKAKLLGEVL